MLSALSVMATAGEVTVSLAEVVMVKAEDCDPDDPNKTQVILQLQSIPTGYVPLYIYHPWYVLRTGVV